MLSDYWWVVTKKPNGSLIAFGIASNEMKATKLEYMENNIYFLWVFSVYHILMHLQLIIIIFFDLTRPLYMYQAV